MGLLKKEKTKQDYSNGLPSFSKSTFSYWGYLIPPMFTASNMFKPNCGELGGSQSCTGPQN
jgi:hypothetical protein